MHIQMSHRHIHLSDRHIHLSHRHIQMSHEHIQMSHKQRHWQPVCYWGTDQPTNQSTNRPTIEDATNPLQIVAFPGNTQVVNVCTSIFKNLINVSKCLIRIFKCLISTVESCLNGPIILWNGSELYIQMSNIYLWEKKLMTES